MKGWTLYAKTTGVEVAATRKVKDFEHKGEKYLHKEGRITLRFFQMENEKVSIRFVLNPIEAHKLARYCKHVATKKPGKKLQVLIHKYEKEGSEITTRLYVEHWKNQKSGKEGFALILSQKNGNNVDVNVPVDKDALLYLADLLHHLSMEQSWWSVSKIGEEEPTSTEEPTDTPDEVVDEADELEDLEEVPDDFDF